jgi:murein DD-endopeptidase MepM/ murein hydrolase activator NlpD
MAEKGALIGAIGSTGYSTGPHLHYEMRIGNRPINPSMLFEADAGLYSAEDAEIGPP